MTDVAASPAAPRKSLHPLAWVPSLYTAESLPFNAVMLVSIMMYKSMGLSDGAIAFWTTWLLLPWTLKPFFSPFLELVRSKKPLVVVTQIVAGAGFGVMAFLIPLSFWLQATLGMFFIMAFNSATHDTAADGLYINALDKEGQSAYVGFQSAFWNIGQVVAQGGLLMLAGMLELSVGIIPAWMIVWGIFGVLMGVFAIYHGFVLPAGAGAVAVADGRTSPASAAADVASDVASAASDTAAVAEAPTEKPPTTIAEALSSFKDVSVDFFLKKNIWWLIAFAFLFRTAEGQVEKIASLFMRARVADGGLGMSTDEVGLAYGTVGTVGMVAGSLVGGWFAAHVGLRKAVLPLAIILNVPNVFFTYLAFSQNTSVWVIAACAAVEKFSLGMGFVSMTLVLMQQMAPGKYSTAHYGYATALMGAGMLVPSMISGFVSDAIGYQNFFVYILIAGLPSILISAVIPIRDDVGSEVVSDDTAGAARKEFAWATAIAAGSFYLFITFSGLVTGPIVAGEPVFASYVWVFGGAGALAILMAVFALGALRRAWSLAKSVGAPTAAAVPVVLVVLSVGAWGYGTFALAEKDGRVAAARSACLASSDPATCELTCDNDRDAKSCAVVVPGKQAAFKAAWQAAAAVPGFDVAGWKGRREAAVKSKEISLSKEEQAVDDAAGPALSYLERQLEAACFTDLQIADCRRVGTIFRDPSAWAMSELGVTKEAADVLFSADLEKAGRYYNKACLIEEGPDCEVALQLAKELAAQKKASRASGAGH